MAKDTTTLISVSLEPALRHAVEAKARKERRSLSNTVACILADALTARPTDRDGSAGSGMVAA